MAVPGELIIQYHSKGSTGGGGIRPCYDGYTLPGVHQVAGDGLSAISIKQSHRHCKFTADPQSRRPLISCAKDIKARNSFWNLHKPDLKKIKGLECATSESVAQLFRAHNVENAGKPTYKKKVLRLLESLVNKKSKTSAPAEVLLQNSHWTAHQSVLAPVMREREIKSPKLISLHSDTATTLNQPEGENQICTDKLDLETIDTLFISLPNGANMQTISSDNTLLGIGFNQVIGPSNGDISSDQFFTPLKETSGLDTARALSVSTVPSCLKLKNKQPLPHIQQNSDCESFSSYSLEQSKAVVSCVGSNMTYYTDSASNNIEPEKDDTNKNTISDQEESLLQKKDNSSEPTEIVICSLFDEMFKEMQEIEDYISSYISSFCVREEEFNNYQALTKQSSQVVEHFFDEVHNQHSTSRVKTEILERSSKTSMNLNNSKADDSRALPKPYHGPEFSWADENEEKHTSLMEEQMNFQVTNSINRDRNANTLSMASNDSGIDMIEFDFEGNIGIQAKDGESMIISKIKSGLSDNLIESDEQSFSNNACSIEEYSIKTLKFKNNFCLNSEFDICDEKSLSEEFVNGTAATCGKVFYEESNTNDYVNIKSDYLQEDNRMEFNDDIYSESVTSGYCFWEDPAMATVLMSDEIPTIYSNSAESPGNFIQSDRALVPSAFIEDVWREYSEGVYRESLFNNSEGNSWDDGGHIPNYGYWANLYDQEVYGEAEGIVNSIENFLVNGCGSPTQRAENHYYNTCTIVEIEDDLFPQTDLSGETNFYMNEGISNSLPVHTKQVQCTNHENNCKLIQSNESFEMGEKESRHSENLNNGQLKSTVEIDLGKPDTSKVVCENATQRPLQEFKNKESLTVQSRFVQIPENTVSKDENPQMMLFTSPNVQLNLTNTIVHSNKK